MPAAEKPATKQSDSGNNKSGRRRVNRSADADKEKHQKRFQPKLNVEEDEAAKSTVIAISRFSSIRQVINYAMNKLKDNWKVEMNGLSLDISKILQATEILKSRVPFLFQETKILTKSFTGADKRADGEEKEFIRTGLSVTLSKNQFEIESKVGYQKPKPRQFV